MIIRYKKGPESSKSLGASRIHKLLPLGGDKYDPRSPGNLDGPDYVAMRKEAVDLRIRSCLNSIQVDSLSDV